jgi:hypothetical protein
MEDLITRAQLVDASEVDAQGITATVPRSDVEEALATDDGPADLILDVARAGDGDPGERRTVAVEWDRGDLERLLRQAEGDAITFAFDRRSLVTAFDAPDVEGHGLREKALILTVAAATAAGAAGAAKAGPDMGEGVMSSSGPAAYSAIESARGGETGGLPSGYGESVQAFRAAEAAGTGAPLAGHSGVEAARAGEAVSTDATAGSTAIEAARAAEAAPDPLLAGYAGIDTVGTEVAAELGTGQAAAEYTAVETARADAPGQTVGGSDGATFAVETPSPETAAALAGAAAIAITGAAFMARSRRRLTPSS